MSTFIRIEVLNELLSNITLCLYNYILTELSYFTKCANPELGKPENQ